jgi:hypothetical protein
MLNCWFLVHKLLLGWRLHSRVSPGALVSTVLSCLLILSPYVVMQGSSLGSMLVLCSTSLNIAVLLLRLS